MIKNSRQWQDEQTRKLTKYLRTDKGTKLLARLLKYEFIRRRLHEMGFSV